MKTFTGGRPAPIAADGFTLIEVVVSMTLMLVLATAALSLTSDARHATGEPDVVDVQQRARGAAELITADLSAAGAGLDRGPLVGPLRFHVPPILPRRAGLTSPDAPNVARTDVITLFRVPAVSAQTLTQDDVSSGALALRVQLLPNCLADGPLCGISRDSTVLTFKNGGEFDFFTVIEAIGDVATLRPWRSGAQTYPAGTVVTAAESDTYYHDSQAGQLRHFDGYLTDIPVVDGVSGLAFEYFGEPQFTWFPSPPVGLSSCLVDGGGAPVPGLVALVPQGGSLASLPLGLFTDGPWCGSGANRFDVDVLRIRRVRLTLTFAAGYTVRADIAPPNLRAGR